MLFLTGTFYRFLQKATSSLTFCVQTWQTYCVIQVVVVLWLLQLWILQPAGNGECLLLTMYVQIKSTQHWQIISVNSLKLCTEIVESNRAFIWKTPFSNFYLGNNLFLNNSLFLLGELFKSYLQRTEFFWVTGGVAQSYPSSHTHGWSYPWFINRLTLEPCRWMGSYFLLFNIFLILLNLL